MTNVEDRLELVELLARYASMPDTMDWDELPRTVLTDPVVMDFESLNGLPATESRLEDLAKRLRVTFTGFQATHHAITNHRINVDGDKAQMRAHIKAEHWVSPELAEQGGNCWLVVGFYDDEAVRTDAGWRLNRVRLTITYQENTHLYGAAILEEKRILGR